VFRKNLSVSTFAFTSLFLFVLVSSQFFVVVYAATPTEVVIDQSDIIGTNSFSIGFQLDGPDIKKWRDSSELQELAQEANFKLVRFFEHRLGKPCVYWNEATRSGQWDWSDLDLLVERIFDIGAEPLIALGFVGYETRRLTSVPNGMSYDSVTGLPDPDQWAAYCAEWVKHFKQKGFPVRYYEMINEAYHYFDWPATQPKLSYYMDLYNAAAKAMRAVNSDVLIGNDAFILKSVLDYFISDGEDLDFLSYHAYGTSSLSATDADIFDAAETKYIEESRTVYGVEKALELYLNYRGIELPVIHAENNVNYHFTEGTDPRIQKMQGAVYNALSFRTSILNGYFHTSYFHFASSARSQEQNPSGGLGFGMVNSDNNQPWYAYYAHQLVGGNLDVGDFLIETTSNSEGVRTVGWINENKLNVLLICKVDQDITVNLNGVSGYFDYFKMDNSVSWRTPRVQSGRINVENPLVLDGYTVMLLQGDLSSVPVPPSPPSIPPTSSGISDDFGSVNFNNWDGTVTSSGESATVVDFQPYYGNYHARFGSNGGGSVENAYSYMNVDEDELYARGYFYVPNGLPLVDNGDRFYFLRFRSSGQSLVGAGIRRNGNVNQWILYARDGSGWVGPLYASGASIEGDRYYCVELYWRKDSSSGLAELYVDGTKLIVFDDLNTGYFGNVDEVDFGLVSVSNLQNNLITYGDCFELSNTYIGPLGADVPIPDDDPDPQPDDGVLYENFESGTFDVWTSTRLTSGETATVVNYPVFAGSYSGRFMTNGNGGYEKAFVNEVLALALDDVVVDGYFRVAQNGLIDNGNRIKFIELRAGSAIIASAGLWQRNGGLYWWLETRNGASYVETLSSSATTDVFDWFSLELRWNRDARYGGGSLWVNGKMIYDITGADTENFGDCSEVHVGLAEVYNCGATTVHVDETRIN